MNQRKTSIFVAGVGLKTPQTCITTFFLSHICIQDVWTSTWVTQWPCHTHIKNHKRRLIVVVWLLNTVCWSVCNRTCLTASRIRVKITGCWTTDGWLLMRCIHILELGGVCVCVCVRVCVWWHFIWHLLVSTGLKKWTSHAAAFRRSALTSGTQLLLTTGETQKAELSRTQHGAACSLFYTPQLYVHRVCISKTSSVSVS